MAFQEYIEIERVEKLTKKEFIENYYKCQKPVVITKQRRKGQAWLDFKDAESIRRTNSVLFQEK